MPNKIKTIMEIDEEKLKIVGNDVKTEKVFLITQKKLGDSLNRNLAYSKESGFMYGLLNNEDCPRGFRVHHKKSAWENKPYGEVEKKIIEEIDYYAKSSNISVQDIAVTEKYLRFDYIYRNIDEGSPIIDKNNKNIFITEIIKSDYKTIYYVYLRDNILQKS